MENETSSKHGNILIYTTEDGKTKVEAIFDGNTVWLTQEQISELFKKSKSTINEHLQNIFDECELDKEIVMTKFGFSEFSRQRPTQAEHDFLGVIHRTYELLEHKKINAVKSKKENK